MFARGHGRPLVAVSMTEIFRANLKRAGVTWPAHFERSAARYPSRAHDLRATAITVWLAHGRANGSVG